ncbi:MAG: OsmC family peroxiredoxin [Anaerolineales bacterium]|nr:MAG: OsmC family peroxiredoxin [Anaerolineales bacterium]
MNAKVVWRSGLSFTGTAETGFEVPLGAHPDVGGENDGFRPMELIAMGVAGCTAMDVISILQKKRQEVTAFEVSVEAVQAGEHPKVFTQMHIHYNIRGVNIDPLAVERAMELSEIKYCPAQAMFKEILPIQLTYALDGA